MESELLHPSDHTEGTCTCRRDAMDDERKPRWDLRGPRVVINGELKSIEFWRSVIAECLATFFFVFLACITTLPWKKGTDSGIIHDSHTQLIQVAMGFGLSLAAMVHCFSHVSGGHINPAVSISMVTTCRISPARGLLYVFAQCGGSIAGAALLYGITPSDNRGDLGVLILHPNINTAQAFGAELVLTFVLVFSTYATYDYGRGIPSGVHPLILGVIMTLLNMVGIPLTGCGLNPARALGPAFIKNYWKRHWIYWLAPVIGGFIAGVLYEYIFDPSRHMRLLSESPEDSDGGSPEGRFSQTNGAIPRGARSHCHENSGYETTGRGNHVEYELHETGDGEAENYRYTRTKF